jgi:hypothetical protein
MLLWGRVMLRGAALREGYVIEWLRGYYAPSGVSFGPALWCRGVGFDGMAV